MKHGQLFAGIGGFGLAAQWAGIENVWANEIDPYCCKVLKKNFSNLKIYEQDIRDIGVNTDTISRRRGTSEDSKIYRQRLSDSSINMGENEPKTRDETERKYKVNLEPVDIVTGGFPCQPFSHAGKRKGKEDDRYLWPEMLRVIQEVNPSFVIGENVAGLKSMENGKTLEGILIDLEDIGYQVETFLVPASAVGAWHRRDRIWIVAHSNSIRSLQQDTVLTRPKKANKSNIDKRDTNANNIIPIRKDVPNTISRGQQRQGKFEQSISTKKGENRKTIGIKSGCRSGQWAVKSHMGGMVDGLPNRMDGYWDSEPEGIPRVATGIKDRVDRLKGLGNAIVPQVAYELFKAIKLLTPKE